MQQDESSAARRVDLDGCTSVPSLCRYETQELTEPRFHQLRDCLTGQRGNWGDSCDFLMDVIDENHSWFQVYRASPENLCLEGDVMKGLWAINHGGNPLRWHHMRMLRRFYFRRYAFGRARAINRLILEERQETWFWLYKDVVVPRAALTLLLGYAAVLGASPISDALWESGKHSILVIALAAAGLLFLWALVYLNARNQAGRQPSLWRRPLFVSLGLTGWACLYSLLTWGLFACICRDFHWCQATAISAAALPLGVLAQFFFSRDSLTDPL